MEKIPTNFQILNHFDIVLGCKNRISRIRRSHKNSVWCSSYSILQLTTVNLKRGHIVNATSLHVLQILTCSKEIEADTWWPIGLHGPDNHKPPKEKKQQASLSVFYFSLNSQLHLRVSGEYL